MSIIRNIEEVQKRSLHLFFLVNASDSMAGKKIGTLNETMRNLVCNIQEIAEDSADADIKISVLKYSSGAEWIYPAPIVADEFRWEYLDAEGSSDFGVACSMLNDALSFRSGFLDRYCYRPYIFLFTDSHPSDNHKNALAQLQKNSWFRDSIKIAIPIGDDVSEDYLVSFTGSKESIINTYTAETISKVIRYIDIDDDRIVDEDEFEGNASKQIQVTYDEPDDEWIDESWGVSDLQSTDAGIKAESKYANIESIPSRVLTLFLVVDTSGSMQGERIAKLNESLSNLIFELRKIQEDSADAKIEIAVLRFSCGAEWICPAPVNIDEFSWSDLVADGFTDFGMACEILNEKLSIESGYLNDPSGCFAPVIMLFMDGSPTDEYKAQLEELKNNNWYRCSVRIGISIGQDADENVLAEFTGMKETIITDYSTEILMKFVRFIAITSSQICHDNLDDEIRGGVAMQEIADIKTVQVVKKLSYALFSPDDWGDLKCTGESLYPCWQSKTQEYVVGVNNDLLYFIVRARWYNNDGEEYTILRRIPLYGGSVEQVVFDDKYPYCTCVVLNKISDTREVYTFRFCLGGGHTAIVIEEGVSEEW